MKRIRWSQLVRGMTLAAAASTASLLPGTDSPAAPPGWQAPNPMQRAGYGLSRRSDAMALVAERADAQIRHGFALAEKGAVYSAEANFIDALTLIANALDAERGTREATTALGAGLKALREADDFALAIDQLASPLDLAGTIAAHSTPVLKTVEVTNLTPLRAMQQYYAYAEKQLAAGGGGEPAASLALYGLGRMQGVPGIGTAPDRAMTGPKAMVLHRAALAVDARNFMAANELGVLFARFGQLEESRRLFEQSLAVKPTVEAANNLARVAEQLGQTERAQTARLQALRAGGEPHGTAPRLPAGRPVPTVVWVDVPTFVANAGPEAVHQGAQTVSAERPAPTPPRPNAAPAERPGESNWSIRKALSRIGLAPAESKSKH